MSKMELIKGTLNVELQAHYVLPESVPRLEAKEWQGPHDVLMQACMVRGYLGVIIRTGPNNRDRGPVKRTVVEVASDTVLRSHFHLESGDPMELEVDI